MKRLRRIRNQELLKAEVMLLKADSCIDCHRYFVSEAMHFDHRPDETKNRNIRGLIDRSASLKTLRIEIAKCDLVCVGCHRIRTISRLQEPIKYHCKGHPIFEEGCRMCGIYNRRRLRSLSLHHHVNILKTNPCFDCKSSFIPIFMDWDHRPGSIKEFSVSFAISSGWQLARILNEISKCDLVCCWCHVLRTINRREAGVSSKTV